MHYMQHPLQHKIDRLRRRVRRRAAFYGLGLTVATLLGATMAAGWIDYLLQFQDRGLRIIISMAVLGAFIWTFRRFAAPVLAMRLRDADLALRVERHFPSLKDQLVSAVEFLHGTPEDPTAGSVALRQAVIEQAAAEASPLDFSEILDRQPMVRTAGVLALVCVVAGMFIVINPSASHIAVTRLANPLGNAAWPKTNHLMLRRPVDRVARGQAFQIEVVDAHGARLPSVVCIHYRFEGSDGAVVEETENLHVAAGVATVRRENVLRPFAYRIEGGDDQSMPWRNVQVIEPPGIESLAIRLIPPSYTGLPPTSSERRIRAIVGTQAQMTGKATTALRAAVLCLKGGARFPAQLGQDGVTFAAAFVVEKSGSYWFELTDREGFESSVERWEVLAVPDAPPTVNIERPSANLFVTPQAIVPLRAAATDDLAVRDVAIEYRQNESKKGQFPLWASTEAPRPQSLSEQEGPTAPDRRTVDYRWDLSPLNLKPGAVLTFHAVVSDYRRQTGASEPRSLTIVSLEDMQNRVADREKIIQAELERVLKMQRGCREQVGSLITSLAEQHPFGQAEVDRLQSVEHNQSEATQVLTSRREGVPTHIRALMADLANNRVSNDDAGRRMAFLLDELDRLGREHLPAIGRELTSTVKTAQAAAEGQGGNASFNRQAASSLAAAAKHQDAVIAAVEQLTSRLSQWDNYRRFPREIGQLLRDQEDVSRRTADVGHRTLTQELREVAPQDAAELKNIADRQLELARILDRTLLDMDQAGRDLQKNDPSAAQMAIDALQHARQSATSGLMLAVGRQIRQNQIGQAAAGQKQVARDLQEILDILNSRPRQPDETSTGEDIARAEEDLQNIRSRQQKTYEETKQLDELIRSESEMTRARAAAIRALALQQHALRDDLGRLGLRVALIGPMADALRGATTDMDHAAALLDKRETGHPVQEVQQSALGYLDKIFEAVKSAKASASKKPPSQASPDKVPPKPDSREGQQEGNTPDAAPPAQQSREPGPKPEGEDVRAVMKRLWGRLPEHARQQMLQLPGEDFSPKYETMIEDYYRRLAEGNDK